MHAEDYSTPYTSSQSYLNISLLITGIKFDRNCLMKIYPHNRSQKFIHALLIRNIRIPFTPDKKNIRKQFYNILILEKIYLLISTLDILLYLFR